MKKAHGGPESPPPWGHAPGLGRAAAGLALLALLWAAASCAPTVVPTATPSSPPSFPSPEPTPSTPPAVILTVWHSWGTEEEALFRAMLQSYQQQHPSVTVRLRRVPVESIAAEYEEAVTTGDGPDLLVGRSHWIGPLAQRQTIAPLSNLLPADYWQSFYPFSLEGVKSGGQLYAVPYAAETVALYYNRDYVGTPPTTTVRLLELAATWTSPEQSGLAFPLSFYTTVGYLYAFGGQLLDSAGRPALDTVEFRAWLDWLQQVRESPGVIAPDSYGEADARFKGGTVAMLVNGSWALNDYQHALGSDRLGVAPLPMLDQTQAWPSPLVGYYVLMVNPLALSGHPQDVLELLRFLGGPECQGTLAANLSTIPTWQAIDLSGVPLLAAFEEQARLGRPRPVTAREQLLWDPLENLLYNVTGRRVPVDAALAETQLRVAQLLGAEEEGP